MLLLSLAAGMNDNENPEIASGITHAVESLDGIQPLQEILNRNFLILNGRKTSLRNIYGDIQPTASNFEIGSYLVNSINSIIDVEISSAYPDVNALCNSGQYTTRTFSHCSAQNGENTAAVIANTLHDMTIRTIMAPQPTTLLIGDARIGKSVALKKIQETLIQLQPSLWTIFIDFSNFYLNMELNDEIQLAGIVEKYVGIDISDLFYNLMEINPKKIVIFFDNIEHLRDVNARKAIKLIKTIIEKRIIVVMTGRASTTKVLIQNQFNTVDYKINDMTNTETEQFLSNNWRTTVINEHLATIAGPSTANDLPQNVEIRLKDYVRAFTYTLFKTPLPRQPVTLEIMADLFKQKSSSPLLATGDPVTCYDYIYNPRTSSPALFIALENVMLNKNTLYENIIKKLRGNRNDGDLSWEYGVVAMVKIIRGVEEFQMAELLVNYFRQSLETAMQTLTGQRDNAIFIDFLPMRRIQFINPEYQYYYAAQYILTWCSDRRAPKIVLQRFFEESKYNNILEFMNFQVIKLPSPHRSIFSSSFFLTPIENSIIFGYENIVLYIYNSMLAMLKADRELAQKFEKFLFTTEIHYIKRLHGKIFGMTVHTRSIETQQEIIQLLKPIEIFVQHNMLRTFETLHTTDNLNYGNNDQYGKIYENLINIAVTIPVSNIKLVKFIIKHFIENLSLNNLNELLYQTINNIGDGSQDIANYLVSCGAQPNVKIEGRTLLHAAVKWSSPNLLRYVVMELFKSEIPIADIADDTGRTIFITALDANPSPLYTFPGWWEMMSYLVEYIHPLSLSTLHLDSLHNDALMFTENEIVVPQFSLLVMSTDIVMLRLQNTNVNPIIHPVEWTDNANDQMTQMTHFVPYTTWQLSPKLLSYRRYCWLKKLHSEGIFEISPLEMLIYYRGAAALDSLQRPYYRKVVTTLLRRESDSLSLVTRIRMYKTIWDNIGDPHDFADCALFSTILTSNSPIIYENLYPIIKNEIERWYFNFNREINTEPIYLNDRIMQTRSNFVRWNIQDIEMFIMMGRLSEYIDQLNQGGRNRNQLLRCFNRRNTRNTHTNVGCLITWQDVDQFNDATARRAITEIRVNSEKYIALLLSLEQSNRSKARQLIAFVKELEKQSHNMAITGKSQMIVKDLLRHGSLLAYRNNQRSINILSNQRYLTTMKQQRNFPWLSRTVALYAASVIPLIRGIYTTVQLCLQQANNDCWYSSGTLALTVTIGPVGGIFVKYLPWMINGFSQTALDMLPSAASPILREHIKLMRYFGLKFGAKTLFHTLNIAGIGFDFYHIVELTKIIDACTRIADSCTVRDQIEYVISLTFSFVSIAITGGIMMGSIGFVPGLLIGLGLMILEGFGQGINDVIYYSNNYDTDFSENFRTFWHKFALQPPPADVQALVRRSVWVNNLTQRIINVLNDNDNIVAYGIGVGHIDNNGITAAAGSINMGKANLINTKNLSRVLPKVHTNLTLLCLPRIDTNEIYDKYSNEVKSAEFSCHNSFVVASTQQWKKRSADKSYIIYDLTYINSGQIVGSNTLNNVFLINNGTVSLAVIGGSGNITNTWIIGSDNFCGKIVLYDTARKNILHLSNIDTKLLSFSWRLTDILIGYVRYNNKYFSLEIFAGKLPNLHVIGRAGKLDYFECYHYTNGHQEDDLFPISVDGRGGVSVLSMDEVYDCKISMIRPFTIIYGSNEPNTTYTTHVTLESSYLNDNGQMLYAKIQPLQSKFMIIFNKRPLLAYTYNVTYILSSKILTWKFQYTDLSPLQLTIEPYHTNFNSNKIDAVNCGFIDNYLGSVIYPVIKLPINESDSVTIEQFNVVATVNVTQLKDVLAHYNIFQALQVKTLLTVTKLIVRSTGQNYIFGSNTNDRFFVDANTTFLFGDNGADVYVLGDQSPTYVWIDNEANDNTLDTLLLPDKCEFLRATIGSKAFSFCDNSSYDVTIFCTSGTTEFLQVILRNYLMDNNYRHLQIYWRDATYILLPEHWREKLQDADNNDTRIDLVLFFSFDQQTNTTITLTSHDTAVILNNTEILNPFVAYRAQMNIIIAKKYLNFVSSSYVVLKDFFTNDTDYAAISTQWQEFKIFSIDNINDNKMPVINTAAHILNLFYVTLFNDVAHATTNEDIINEYIVNVNTNSTNKTHIIEHNFHTTE